MGRSSDRTRADWEAIEREYRAGSLTICEIARKYNTLESSVRMRAKRKNWTRDLTEQVRVRARAKITHRDVRTPVSRTLTDDDLIEAAADRSAVSVEGHLVLARRLAGIAAGNLDALEAIQRGERPRFDPFLGRADGYVSLLRATADLVERYVSIERRALNLDAEHSQVGNIPVRYEIVFSPPPAARVVPGPAPSREVIDVTPAPLSVAATAED